MYRTIDWQLLLHLPPHVVVQLSPGLTGGGHLAHQLHSGPCNPPDSSAPRRLLCWMKDQASCPGTLHTGCQDALSYPPGHQTYEYPQRTNSRLYLMLDLHVFQWSQSGRACPRLPPSSALAPGRTLQWRCIPQWASRYRRTWRRILQFQQLFWSNLNPSPLSRPTITVKSRSWLTSLILQVRKQIWVLWLSSNRNLFKLTGLMSWQCESFLGTSWPSQGTELARHTWRWRPTWWPGRRRCRPCWP